MRKTSTMAREKKADMNGRLKRRDDLSIIADMLEVAKSRSCKTRIMYRANLSFTQLNGYMALLVNNNFVEQHKDTETKEYMITEQGSEFLQKYRELTSLFKKETEDLKVEKKADLINNAQ
jgi:predicted transcriptional regulator